MPRKWLTKEVDDHGGGITDDIKNAPPVYQEEANNIIYDFKSHNLSNRDGSQILRNAIGDDFNQDLVAALDGYRIEQIFQLENHLIISAWSDTTYSGKFVTYDEKTLAVTLAQTPTTRKGLNAYSFQPIRNLFWIRVVTSDGKGVEGYLRSFGLDADNTNYIDHLVFNIFVVDGFNNELNIYNYPDRTNVTVVEIAYRELFPDGSIGDNTGLINWGEILDLLNNTAGHLFDYIDGTTADDVLILDGDLTVNNEYTKTQWGDENEFKDLEKFWPSITSLGHLQPSVYIGESFIATEPYDKSFQVNPLDKDMADPENFAPLTERDTIKRISNFWDGEFATPKIRDAQMPTAYISRRQKEFEGDQSAGVPGEFNYFNMQLRIIPGAPVSPEDSYIDVWLDRRWGYSDVGGPTPFLSYEVGLDTDLVEGEFAFLDYQEVQDDVLGSMVAVNAIGIDPGQTVLMRSADQFGPEIIGSDLLDLIKKAMEDYNTRGNNLYPDLGFNVAPSGIFSVSTSYTIFLGPSVLPVYTTDLPEGVGNFTYNYSFHLQESYTKTDDSVPKLVENNGPAAFVQVGTLSEISATSNIVNQSTLRISLSPAIFGSISRRFTRYNKEWFDFNDIAGIFSRTQNTGTVYYEVGRTNLFVPNDLSKTDPQSIYDPADWDGESYGYFVQFTDKNFDRDIISFELSYFNGGVLSYTGLPQGSYFMNIINGTAYFGNIIDNQSRVYQSAPGIPSSSPSFLFSDFEDPMTAVNSFLEKPIVFTENKTWRIEGIRDATGVGRVFLRVVSDEFGCIANQSVIKTNVGLFYWSKVGVIFTDGLRALRVSEHLLARFDIWKAALMPNGLEIGPRGLRSAYNEVTKQIIFSAVDPRSVETSLEIYIPPTVSPAYIFPKGLPQPQVNLLTFDADLITGNSTLVNIGGIDGSPVVFNTDHDTTMGLIATQIGVDFPGLATAAVLGSAGSRVIKVNAAQTAKIYTISAEVTLGASQANVVATRQTNHVWEMTAITSLDLTLEITVDNDGDAFFNELAARLNSKSDEVIKVVDRQYQNWTFTTNVHVEEDAVTVVTKTDHDTYYVVNVALITSTGTEELWTSEVTLEGVLVPDRQDIIDDFIPYTSLDYAPWEANNNPGSFQTIDPQNFTWYDFVYSLAIVPFVASQPGGSQGPYHTIVSATGDSMSQSFTATEDGTLQDFQFFLVKTGAPDFTMNMSLRDWDGVGTPTSGNFFSTTTLETTAAVSGQLNDFSFSSPIAVIKGQQYTITMSVGASTLIDGGNNISAFGEDGLYDEGFFFFFTGAVWIQEPTKDWGFSVAIVPAYQVSIGFLDAGIMLITFIAIDNAQLATYVTELESFLSTGGSLLWITDQAGVQWKLISKGVDLGEFPDAITKDGQVVVMRIRDSGFTDLLDDILKDEVSTSYFQLFSTFVPWENNDTGFNLWTQYNGMGIRKTLHLGAKHPAPDPYGVPIWINLDLYYGLKNTMPFYTADGPHLLRESRRYQRDTFQTRVVWFSEDTLNVYRGQIGYDDYDEARVLGSVILAHENLLTADETYKSLTKDNLSPIDPYYKSIAISHGFKGARKWTSKVMINFVDLQKTGVSIQPLGWNDLNPKPHLLGKCINYQHFTAEDFSPPVDPAFPPTIIQYFKNTDAAFYGDYLISYKRRFPKGRIRNVYKQFGFQQLVQDYLSLTTDNASISAVTITKVANEPFSPVNVRVDLVAPLNTYVRGNGASYAQFSWSKDFFRITEVLNDNQLDDPSYLEFIALTSPDELSTTGIVIDNEAVMIGRAPLDQAIQLSDWTLTYTIMGDRTQGVPKSTELGGHN